MVCAEALSSVQRYLHMWAKMCVCVCLCFNVKHHLASKWHKGLMIWTFTPLHRHLSESWKMSPPVSAPACPCTGIRGRREAWEAGNCSSTLVLSAGKPTWSQRWIINDVCGVSPLIDESGYIGYSHRANTGITQGKDNRDDFIALLLLRHQFHCIETVCSFFLLFNNGINEMNIFIKR